MAIMLRVRELLLYLPEKNGCYWQKGFNFEMPE
jgi:hypothetical protein